MEGGRGPGDRGRLHRRERGGVSVVAGTRCVGGEPEGEMADRAGWIEGARQGEKERDGGEKGRAEGRRVRWRTREREREREEEREKKS